MTVPQIALTAPVGPDDAPLAVLGPSLGTSTILWEDVVPALVKTYRVALWDLPGHGAGAATKDGFTVAELADGVAEAVARTGADRILYAGVSLGGATGLELLLRHPQLISAAAICCSAAKFGEPQAWQDRAAQVRTQGTASLVSAQAGRWFAPGSMERRPELTGRLLHALRDADDASYAACCDALASYDVTGRLGEITAPVLALFGEEDPVTPESAAKRITDGVRAGRAVGIADASHLAPAEQPDAVAKELLVFFEEARA